MSENRNKQDQARDLLSGLLGGNLSQLLRRYSDLALAALVITMIAVIFVPMPTFILDLFLAANMTLAVTLLMVSLYVPRALSLASFPSILLIATVFRLALNVSSTRLILLNGYAGEVIESFGKFVVQGQFGVGFVIFLVITLVQFIVIAKGAERVSEVAARFTLDALPGKQMSIDADLRAGLIDVHEAKARREYLGRESQFYGAMDGAMKFVKGDAIVGIVVSLVNIAAGVSIGVVSKGLEFSAAASKYILLTVGDGLVSQIPSLVIATTAGIITTRVATGGDEDAGQPLGQEIGEQILAQPRAIGIAATTLLFLGLIPGLPTVPFLALAAGGWGLVWSLHRSKQQQEADPLQARIVDGGGGALPAGGGNGGDSDRARLPVSQPVILEASPQVTQLVDANRDPRFVQQLIPEMRDWMFQDLGVHFPGVKVRGDAAYLDENSYTIHVNEVPAATGEAYPGHVYANADGGYLAQLGIRGIPGDHPSLEQEGLWIPATDAERAGAVGIQLMQPDEYMAIHLANVLRRNVDQLIGIQDTQNILDLLEQQGFETLVSAVVPKLVSVQRLTDVLKRLLHEDISIRNMRLILEALAQWAPFENDPVYLTEYVRMGLKNYIAYKVTEGRPLLSAWVLDPEIEQALEAGIRQSASGSSLELDPSTSQAVINGFRAALSGVNGDAVVLTQMEVRYFLGKLLRHQFRNLTVLSFQELPSDLQIQPVGRVQMASGLVGAGDPAGA